MEKQQNTDAIIEVANALHRIGFGNAETKMGALENLAVTIKESNSEIAESLDNIADAIRTLAQAVSETGSEK